MLSVEYSETYVFETLLWVSKVWMPPLHWCPVNASHVSCEGCVSSAKVAHVFQNSSPLECCASSKKEGCFRIETSKISCDCIPTAPVHAPETTRRATRNGGGASGRPALLSPQSPSSFRHFQSKQMSLQVIEYLTQCDSRYEHSTMTSVQPTTEMTTPMTTRRPRPRPRPRQNDGQV